MRGVVRDVLEVDYQRRAAGGTGVIRRGAAR
jgi:hypothetical protein